MRMLGFGDSVADCYIDTGIMYPGGNALNAAVFAKMLGADASYIGYMGDDSVGRYILETVSNRIGLEVSRCRLFHGAHGYTYVRHIQGDRIFISSNHGGIAAKHPMAISEEDKNYIKMFDWIHTSCFSFAQGALPDLSESGAFISMDFSDEFDDEMFRKCCPFIDCACISAGKMSEEKIFRISEQLFSYGCRQMVLATRGSQGAFLNIGGTILEQSPNIVKASDTMAAGDAFIAAFLYTYLGLVKDSCDFPETLTSKGIIKKKEMMEASAQIGLYKGALFASENCRRQGSFGYGKVMDSKTKENLCELILKGEG